MNDGLDLDPGVPWHYVDGRWVINAAAPTRPVDPIRQDCMVDWERSTFWPRGEQR